MNNDDRLNSEWVVLNAFRGMTKIASKGDARKSTYDNSLDLGGELYPDLLGPNASILRRERESDTAKEYRQKARLKSIKNGYEISPHELIQIDIDELNELLNIAKIEKQNQAKVDQLRRKLTTLVSAEKELNIEAHTENQLIFRDALAVERRVPSLASGKSYRDFELPDGNILRVRVLHPDKPEHITGADIIYERHNPNEEKARIVAVQYKIWDNKTMYLTDERMKTQLSRLELFTCEQGLCNPSKDEHKYRFPCCTGFLRPTDKLQRPDQEFISSGEHLPICQLDECKSITSRGAEVLEFKNIRDISLSSEMFEQLFNKGKIGSRLLTYDELQRFYDKHEIDFDENTMIIYAQEFAEQL